MRDSKNPNVQFLWDRVRATTRADASDAGMAYFLMTGNEEARPSDLRTLLDEKNVIRLVGERKFTRIEAENFQTLRTYQVEDRADRSASHRLNVKLSGAAAGEIRTFFDEPYTASSGRYDVDVRYLSEKGGPYRLSFHVNGVRQGDAWTSSGDEEGWKTQTIADVPIETGDEISIQVQGQSGVSARLDYVQLNRRSLALGSAPVRLAVMAMDRPVN